MGGKGFSRTSVDAPAASAAEAVGGDVGRQGNIVGVGRQSGEDFTEEEAGTHLRNNEHAAASDESDPRLPGPVSLIDGGGVHKTAHRAFVAVCKLPCQIP